MTIGAENLTRNEVLKSADSIRSSQLNNGLILWFTGGHGDPWNHVEAAMALAVSGLFANARKAYTWLADSQEPGGYWWNYYDQNGPTDKRIDLNVCAYPALGVWQYYLLTKNKQFLKSLFENVEAAIDFVIAYQQDSGEIIWAIEPDGTLGTYALLTGCSSIAISMQAALMICDALRVKKPEWELSLMKLLNAIANKRDIFEPKDRYAMDWYYPILSGALGKPEALLILEENWDKFVDKRFGVRCVSDRNWFTTAETAELAIALDGLGFKKLAQDLLNKTRLQRLADGFYFTGMVYPQEVTFPVNERTSYSAAAVILADYAISTNLPASSLWRDIMQKNNLIIEDFSRNAPEYS